MSVPAPAGLPRRVLVAVGLADERRAGAAEFVAHGARRALAPRPPLSPHLSTAGRLAAPDTPSTKGAAPVQALAAPVSVSPLLSTVLVLQQ